MFGKVSCIAYLSVLNLICLINLNAQVNLVPNPGFDILSSCPSQLGQIERAIGWTSATNGTPDLYNTCSNNLTLKVPHCPSAYSYQQQRSGDGYAYIVNLWSIPLLGNSEYLQSELTELLDVDQMYYVEFFVSPDFIPNETFLFSDGIGLSFSDTAVNKTLTDNETLPMIPDIEQRGRLIKDTAGWTRISGCYRAAGTERFIVLGNFRTILEMSIEYIDSTRSKSSELYIEDVGVFECDVFPDTLILCEDEALQLDAHFLHARYVWNTGDTASKITINKGGQYWVEVDLGNCIFRDTVNIIEYGVDMQYSLDTSFCSGSEVIIKPKEIGDYTWSDGSTEKYLELHHGGQYELLVENRCGLYEFSYDVEEQNCQLTVYCPSAFSPNNDGINDNWTPLFDFDYLEYELKIYDRYGASVFEARAPEEVWDGYFLGKLLETGTYTFTLLISNSYERKILSGYIVLLQ